MKPRKETKTGHMNQTHNWQFPPPRKMTKAKAFDDRPADKAFVKTFLSPPSHPQTVDIGVLNTRDISDVDI